MSKSSCILQFPLKDSSEVVLVNVEQESATNIKLFATEGENGYAAAIIGGLLNGCNSATYEGKAEEREAALSWLLLQHLTDRKYETLVPTVEVTAVLVSAKTITLTFRQKLEGGYTQLFGEIELQYDPELELELFDWTKSAAKSTKALLDQGLELDRQLRAKDSELASLRLQFDDLIAAKTSHEDELVEKFRLLLNSKKLKIRDQQRLLASTDRTASASDIDRSRQAELPPSSSSSRRRAKRKAENPAERAGSESSDGFNQANKEFVGDDGDAETDDEMAADTPDMSDAETADGPASSPENAHRQDSTAQSITQPIIQRSSYADGQNDAMLANEDEDTDDEL